MLVDIAVDIKKKSYVKSTASNSKSKGKEKLKVNNKKVDNVTKDEDINNTVD